MKLTLPFVETMITQVCNLSCQGCTNYSDLKHSGFVSWEQGREEISQWLNILDIPDFGIMGGEPLINPQVRKWITGVRDLMPNSQIRFTTNGLLLEKNLDVVDLLCDIGNSVFKITVHVDDTNLENLIQQIFSRYDFKPVKEYGIDRWAYGSFRFQINRPTKFVKSYKGTYETMTPYASDPKQAFDICCQQTCPLLYQGNIYKCSTSALLYDTLARFNRLSTSEWHDYIHNTEYFITTDSDQLSVSKFVENFGKHQSICGMCPTKLDSAEIDHQKTVFFK